jgi:hypothetical protein
MIANREINSPSQTEMLASSRVRLVNIGTVRAVRGCDAETVLKAVGDITHPHFLRWVFNVAVKSSGRIRDLRFWKDELCGTADKWAKPETVIDRILGDRGSFPRGEIEVEWTINATTISKLVRAGEIDEVSHRLTRASLAAFLKRRLQ